MQDCLTIHPLQLCFDSGTLSFKNANLLDIFTDISACFLTNVIAEDILSEELLS